MSKAWRRTGRGPEVLPPGELLAVYEIGIDTMTLTWTDDVFLPEPDHWDLELRNVPAGFVPFSTEPGPVRSLVATEFSITYGPGTWEFRIQGIPAIGDPGPWVKSNQVVV